MYCVFCGKLDVESCQSCARWVCPRHRGRWFSRTVCVGCRRRLIRVLCGQIAVAMIAIGLIGLTVVWAIKQ